MHYLIYKITNNINKKIYIGAHQTKNINDLYMGSGRNIKLAMKKYGKDNFIKEILYDFDNQIEMYTKERELVNEDFLKRSDTYNCKLGGRGGSHVFLNEEEKKIYIEKISETQKNRYANGAETWNKGVPTSKETRDKISNSLKGKMAGENNPMFGKPCNYKMTDEEKESWKQNRIKGLTGKKRTEEHKKNYSIAASKRIWLVHKSGKATHTQNPNDQRLSDPDWQRGKKWKGSL